MDIKKITIDILLNHPFYATILLNCNKIADKSIKTAMTDGKNIHYNPEFLTEIGYEYAKTVLAHEVLHIAFMHMTRRGNRNPKKWNIACDYAINQLLANSNFSIPQDALISPMYNNMSAEQIYTMLPDNDDESDNDNNDPGGLGEVRDGADTQTSKDQLEQEIKQLVQQAINNGKKAGDIPGNLSTALTEVLEPRVSWREILYQFVCEIVKNDYTWKQPNSRYLSSGIYLPSLRNEEIGDIIMLVDTSGSVSQHMLNQFAGELQSILSNFARGFKVIYVDTEVANVQDIEPDDIFNLEVKGRGGTDFEPGFQYIEEKGLDPKCVIYFTDGECSNFPDTPDYPVLWACTDKNFKAPFGETVFVDTNLYN